MSSELTTDKWLNLDAVTPETLDLNNCDREPIHIPNSIQPHGILLANYRVRSRHGLPFRYFYTIHNRLTPVKQFDRR